MHSRRIAIVLSSCLLVSAVALAGDDCTTIQDGTLVNSAGETLETGYDVWSYNYQAQMFNGLYCDAYRDASWCQAWADVGLMMKWNDAWLSSSDCDGDGLLDRHHGHETYRGSGAWLTNHMDGEYEDPNGGNRPCKWTYFVKIVAAPSDAELRDRVWYDGSGDEIGPQIWSDFAIVQEVENDPCAEQNGISYKGSRPALGNWESDPDTLPVDEQ